MTHERKKILFLVPAFAGGVGGAERVIATLLRHLDHSRFECHLALVGAGNAFLDSFPESGNSALAWSRPECVMGCLASLSWSGRLKPQTILSTVCISM